MRYQGKITSWKDDQGFGFVTPNGGGEPAFLHIKAFARCGRRPLEGDIVTYEPAMDAKGRARAERAALVEARSQAAASGGRKTGSGWPMLAVLFFVVVGTLALADRLPPVVVGVYGGASLLAFVVYASDKSAARGGRWRTAESTLHLIALFGGWPGALMAQRVLRHKSSKASFQAMFWLTVLINCGVLGWLLTAKGAAVLRSVLAGTA